MRALALAATAAFFLVAAASAESPMPMPSGSTDPEACSWHWKSGGGLGVWTERCEFVTGVWEAEPRDELPGFVVTLDGEVVDTVLQVFAKPADAGIDAILPELRARGYIPDDEECVFAPAAVRAAPRTVAFFEIWPIGSRLAAFEATPDDEVPEPPCGDYGWSTHGTRYFMTDVRFPDQVVYVNTGQDGLMFDETTVTIEP